MATFEFFFCGHARGFAGTMGRSHHPRPVKLVMCRRIGVPSYRSNVICGITRMANLAMRRSKGKFGPSNRDERRSCFFE